MLFWILIGGMTATALLLLLRPLLRGGGTESERPGPRAAAPDLAIYRDQLAEIERDLAQGVLSAEEAAAARLEVERRILTAASAADRSQAATAPRPPGRHRLTAAALAGALPVAALAIYLALGAPDLAHLPSGAGPGASTQTAGAPTAEDAEMTELVEKLAERLAADPSDPNGWLLLARSYGTLGRFGEAAEAYEQAIAHGAAGAEPQAAYGEALTAAAGGQVTGPAAAAFRKALEVDPKNPRARFYLAVARAQSGRLDEALEMWVALEADAPADAPWRAAVSAQIERAAQALGRDPETLPGRVAKAAPADRREAAEATAPEAMSPEDREAFIRGMVDRLAARLRDSPDDVEGWLRLARSYEVLGEREKALEAWEQAAHRAPERADVLLGYATALLGGWAGEGHPLPDAFAPTVEKVRALDPENPLGLYFAGLAAATDGDAAAARALWTKVLARLPEGSAERADLQRRIDALDDKS